jgi:[ribosomal protein S18]-alanine N-acetyltransferase
MYPERNAPTAVAWQVRAFRPSDASTISEILRDSSEAAQWPPESYANLAQSPGGVLLVCEANAQVIAFVAARQASDEAEILNLAVHRNFRRRGVASALLLAALDTFRRSAIAHVFLELRESNLPARSLYGRHGFVPTGRRKSYYCNPTEDAVCMLRKFTASAD